MNNDKIKVELEEINEVKKKLDITVSADIVKQQIREAYANIRSNASIPRYRTGHIPITILKARFAAHVRDEVTRKLIEQAYPHALGEKGLSPIDAPQIDITKTKLEEGEAFSFTATVEVTPKVEISGYKGMELTKKELEVADKDVDESLESLRESRAQFKEVDRPAKDGDLVVVDFEGFINGKPIKYGKSENYPIILGEKTLLPGFDDALKGSSKGDNKEARIKFPENYSEEEMRGKDGDFKIAVKSVKEKRVPAMDDPEFLKAVECDSVETLKTRMKDELRAVKEARDKERLKNEILDNIIASHSFDVPEGMVNRYLSATLGNVLTAIKQGGGSLDDRNLSPEDLKAKYRKVAERQV
ncbi:MAG: trigger factor, partial [Deltaproteobacteria bacterium]|nr:trigger factor [Deltaproteobacteria bacterium]